MNYETAYKNLIGILKDADTDGLFDMRTSEVARVNSCHRKAIREAIRLSQNVVPTVEYTY